MVNKEKWSPSDRIKMVKKLSPYLLVVTKGQEGDEVFLINSIDMQQEA